MNPLQNLNGLDAFSLAASLLIILECVLLLRERTTLALSIIHVGLIAIGMAAFWNMVSLLYAQHEAHWPGMALNAGLAATLGVLTWKGNWDGRKDRRQRNAPVRDINGGTHINSRFGRIE